LRVKSGKSVGGQEGHDGHTLLRQNHVDNEIMLEPHYCTHCGESVEHIKGAVLETRQMIDIPLPVAELTVLYDREVM